MINLREFLKLFAEGKVAAKSHMKNLLEMAMADGHFDDSERDLLFDIADKHNVSRKQLNNIQRNPLSITFVLPESEEERFKQLHELVNMMVVDGYTDSSELKLCHIFARKLGYKRFIVGELVYSISQNILNGNDWKETQKRVSHLLKTVE